MKEIRNKILEGSFSEYYKQMREELIRGDAEEKIQTPRIKLKDRGMNLGDFEILTHVKGFSSIRQKSSGEVMHSVNHPDEEARAIYIGPAAIEKRISLDRELIVWDVGLGAGHNSMALIKKIEELKFDGQVRIISFEQDLDPLKLALNNSAFFPHLHHPAPAALINESQWLSKDGKLHWQLSYGNFLDQWEKHPSPQIIFFDPFSFHTNPELWTLEVFQKIFLHCQNEKTQLLTYTASTRIRSLLLAAGFFVAQGPSSGPKESTTQAYTHPALIKDLGATLLSNDWLAHWHRSSAKDPSLTEKLENHPQFQDVVS